MALPRPSAAYDLTVIWKVATRPLWAWPADAEPYAPWPARTAQYRNGCIFAGWQMLHRLPISTLALPFEHK